MTFQTDHSVRARGAALAESDARVVEAVVASAFALRPHELRQASRGSAGAAFARQVAMYLSHTRLGVSYTAAGTLFGRDRTTAAHACRTVEDRREDPHVDAVLDCLERAIDAWRSLPNP